MKSIQTKFISLILGCVLFCSAIVGGAGLMHSTKVADEDSAKIMNLICSEQTENINGMLSRMEQSVQTLAAYAVQELESAKRLKSDPAYVEQYTKSLEEVVVNAARNTEGAVSVYMRFNPTLTNPTAGTFWNRTNMQEPFEKLPPTDLSIYDAKDVDHVGWYYIPVRAGKATWMEPYVNRNIDVNIISYVIPIYKDEEVVGIVGMDIDFATITDKVEAIRIYESGYAFLANKSAMVMYHPEVPTGMAMTAVDRSLWPVVSEIGKGSSETSLFRYQWKGEERRMAFRSLVNGMCLTITAPAKEINAAKNQLTLQIVVAVTLISGAAVLITIAITRRMVRPLRELNEAAQKIVEGDLGISLVCNTKDEVGQLSVSFQKTVDHLQKYISYINDLAYRDPLTGVKNKTAYLRAIEQKEEEMRRGYPEFAVVVFDINGLKIMNDTYGHDFGDMLIMNGCRLVCRVFKHSPVFRIGGDEFVTLLEGADYENYKDLLVEFEEQMASDNRNRTEAERVSMARGIAVFDHESDLIYANVFKRADDAMYQNKAAMKERVKAPS